MCTGRMNVIEREEAQTERGSRYNWVDGMIRVRCIYLPCLLSTVLLVERRRLPMLHSCLDLTRIEPGRMDADRFYRVLLLD